MDELIAEETDLAQLLDNWHTQQNTEKMLKKCTKYQIGWQENRSYKKLLKVLLFAQYTNPINTPNIMLKMKQGCRTITEYFTVFSEL